jgi:diadenosine tetraphosphate (Ap4A) HIT family hydrolase
MPRDEWDKRIKGDDCSMCQSVRSDAWEDQYSYKIADMQRGKLYLQRNQYVKGYCLLIANRHYTELHDMRPQEYSRFLEDMVKVGAALEKVFSSDKMNYQILGNIDPHVHAHIMPRYYGDDGGNSPINPVAQEVTLTDAEYKARVYDIREALGLIRKPITDPVLARLVDDQGRVDRWPALKVEEEQMAVRLYLASKFEPGRTYSEREVNEILNQWHTFEDWALLRRELFMYGLLARYKDGTSYWVPEQKAEETP